MAWARPALLKAISGNHHRSGGDYSLAGETDRPVFPRTGWRRWASATCRRGAMIFPLLTVTENLETGFACLPRAERKIPDRIFELFPVLKDMEDRRGGDLSGGQQQQLPSRAR
jgi:urea transport system ATP-binding protein